MKERNIIMFAMGDTYGFMDADSGEIIGDYFTETEALAKAEKFLGYQNPKIGTFFECVSDYEYNKTIDEELVLVGRDGSTKGAISTRGIYIRVDDPLMGIQSFIGRIDGNTVKLQLLENYKKIEY